MHVWDILFHLFYCAPTIMSPTYILPQGYFTAFNCARSIKDILTSHPPVRNRQKLHASVLEICSWEQEAWMAALNLCTRTHARAYGDRRMDGWLWSLHQSVCLVNFTTGWQNLVSLHDGRLKKARQQICHCKNPCFNRLVVFSFSF